MTEAEFKEHLEGLPPLTHPVIESLRPVVRELNFKSALVWAVTLTNGLGTVVVTHADLLSYKRFQACCATQLYRVFGPVPRDQWLAQVSAAVTPWWEKP